MTNDGAHIEALITFLLTEKGGRKSAVFSGYRPQFYYDGEDWDSVHTYLDTERVLPGDTVVTRITFLSPEHHRGKLYPGMAFEVREGARVVGRGVIRRVFDLE